MKKEQEMQNAKMVDEHVVNTILKQFAESNKRCVLLDYDGTLAPFQKLPSLAIPSQETIQLLRDLAKDDRNEVVVISGRDNDILEKWMGHLPVTLVAEHGAF